MQPRYRGLQRQYPPHLPQTPLQISCTQPSNQFYNSFPPAYFSYQPQGFPSKNDFLKELSQTANQIVVAVYCADLEKLHYLGRQLTYCLPFVCAAGQDTRSFQDQLPSLPQPAIPGPSLAQGETAARKRRRRNEITGVLPHEQKRRNGRSLHGSSAPTTPIKKCLECDKSDTIQWRSGPFGKSTLCNTCGMRFWRYSKKRRTAQTTAGESSPSPSSSPQPDESSEPSPQPERKQSNVYSLLN